LHLYTGQHLLQPRKLYANVSVKPLFYFCRCCGVFSVSYARRSSQVSLLRPSPRAHARSCIKFLGHTCIPGQRRSFTLKSSGR